MLLRAGAGGASADNGKSKATAQRTSAAWVSFVDIWHTEILCHCLFIFFFGRVLALLLLTQL